MRRVCGLAAISMESTRTPRELYTLIRPVLPAKGVWSNWMYNGVSVQTPPAPLDGVNSIADIVDTTSRRADELRRAVVRRLCAGSGAAVGQAWAFASHALGNRVDCPF